MVTITIAQKTPSEPDAANDAKVAKIKERLLVTEYALLACNLLEPPYYDDVCDAVLTKNFTKFKAVCNRANITDKNIFIDSSNVKITTEELQEQLYKIFVAGPTLGRMW